MFRCCGGSDQPGNPELDECKEKIAQLSAELKASQMKIDELQHKESVQKTVSQKDGHTNEFQEALRKRKAQLIDIMDNNLDNMDRYFCRYIFLI